MVALIVNKRERERVVGSYVVVVVVVVVVFVAIVVGIVLIVWTDQTCHPLNILPHRYSPGTPQMYVIMWVCLFQSELELCRAHTPRAT